MATVLHCDICNKRDSLRNPIGQFQVKKLKSSFTNGGIKVKWERLDICRTCLNTLRQAAVEKEKALEAYEEAKKNGILGI